MPPTDIGGICTMIEILHRIKRGVKAPLFFIIVFVDLCYTLIVSWVINEYNPDLIDVIPSEGPYVDFFLQVIAGPLLETFLFQFLVIELLLWLCKKKGIIRKNGIIIWTSAVLFGLTHYYNLVYIVIIIFPGLLYASYYLFLKLEQREFPFVKIFMVHAVANFVAFLIDYVP